ncbi:hypothetical protein EKO27_g4170 [Xylaria grammica]|uniref:Carrier domain-containing protein n=1 Tax=Xylaria grammica TaxID=363999 RepID=A0A439D9C3_9PEZI|nr:hypothetical protein EKO27_g4170 [Xylaria grammica]
MWVDVTETEKEIPIRALVVGANLLLAPELTAILGNMGFLSPDGRCFSFDKRANGYARGEGVLAVIVKPLVDAVADNNTIRAIIRSSGSNQDGRTPSLTQPNAISQEKLIRHVYQKAGLDPYLTRYVEAHGDPTETSALLRAFRDYRLQHEPLYLGSIKSNIGHLEGGSGLASGLASIVKTVLILEKGLIPPNALLDEVNPDIDTGSGRIVFPKESVGWPGEGFRRASINSFGIGGTNSHLVLDDACKYLHMRRLQGHHVCRLDIRNSVHGAESKPQDGIYPIKLLVWSAADEGAVRRMIKDFEVYYGSSVIHNPSKLNQLAYTLAERRSRMAWRAFATLDATESFKGDSLLALTKPIRALNRSVLAFIFTGQGAHYADMGLELLQYPVFERALGGINHVYAEVGCRWNLIGSGILDELHRKDHIALVKLLREFGVHPSAVVGHSSGEIAAASVPLVSYVTGALSERAASIIAYHRGQLAGKLRNSAGTDEAMCAIREQLEKDDVFAQKLDVGVAHHTKAMLAVAAEYSELLACLTDEPVRETDIHPDGVVGGREGRSRTVSGQATILESILPDGRAVTDVVEIGPHPALRRHVHDTFKAASFPRQRKGPGYYFLLHREKNARRTLLEFIGRLFCLGYPVSLSTADSSSQDPPPAPLVDYPQYPFNTSLHYWAEPRLRFLHPIVVDQNAHPTETILYLWPSQEASTKDAPSYQVKICAHRDGSRWLECFTAHLQAELDQGNGEADRGKELHLEAARFSEKHNKARAAACDKSVSQQAFYEFTQEIGIQYLKSFQLLHEIGWDRQMRATASVRRPLRTRESPTPLLHPTVLDACLQLTLVPISAGLSSKIEARVPRYLRNAWISAKGWDAVSANVSVTAREMPGAGNHANDIHVMSNEGHPLCVIEDLKGSQLLYGIDWKPQLSLLSPQQLRQWCHVESSPVDEATLGGFLEDMESALIISLRQALRRISDEDLRSTYTPAHQAASSISFYPAANSDAPDHGVTIAAARNLRALITRERDPLEVFFRDGLAERFYDAITNDVFKPDAKRSLDLASHERPNLRLLEVGAGTGSMTQRVLAALLELEARDGAAKFQDYTYTDISTAFFEAARNRSHDAKSRIMYRTLDLELDPIEQGYEEGAYDIVLAGSVLHATADLAATLREVNIVWGLLPSWWLAKEDWRVHSPLASEQKWDELLRETGFSGNDVVVRDSEGTSSHVWSLVVSTAARKSLMASTTLGSGRDIIVIVDPKSRIQQSIAEILVDQQSGSIKCLSEARGMKWEPSMILVSLLEVGTLFLADMSKEGFEQLQQAVSGPQRVVWVTLTGISDTNFPKFQLATGFFRTLQSESPSKTFVTLAIESCDTTSPGSAAVHVLQVLTTPLQDNMKTDYVVRDGLLHTGRLLRNPSTGEELDRLVSPTLREEPWQSGSGVKLEIGTPGILDTLRFVEDPDFRDLMVSLGQLEGEDGPPGLECAGMVTRAGSRCSNRKPGDPVVLVRPGSARSHPRAHWKATVKIPHSLSLEEAVSVINPAMAAYRALVDLARIEKGEKVLIHSAAGSTGQMAILIANWVGAEVFATVGYNDKKDFLVREFHVAEDHIFYSRDPSFAKGVMRMTHGRGVDVILNSLSGQALQSTWECTAPYGRFVEMGKTDIQTNTPLPMGRFWKNVSFFALDVQHISQTDLDLTQRLLTSVVDMLTSGIIKPPLPTRVFPPQRVEEAFRTVQSGKHTVWRVRKMYYPMVGQERGQTSHRPFALGNVLLSDGGRARAVLAACGGTMPPVKGYINSANILQDAIFENMTYEQWDLTVRTKLTSSWALHALLPADLDFFVLLSSVSGLHGIPSQSNYAASCTYQDALARYRVAHGRKATSLGMGWMQAVGIVAETDRYTRTTQAMAHIDPISEDALLALLDVSLRPVPRALGRVAEPGRHRPHDAAAGALAEGEKPTRDLLRPMFSAFLRLAVVRFQGGRGDL